MQFVFVQFRERENPLICDRAHILRMYAEGISFDLARLYVRVDLGQLYYSFLTRSRTRLNCYRGAAMALLKEFSEEFSRLSPTFDFLWGGLSQGSTDDTKMKIKGEKKKRIRVLHCYAENGNRVVILLSILLLTESSTFEMEIGARGKYTLARLGNC